MWFIPSNIRPSVTCTAGSCCPTRSGCALYVAKPVISIQRSQFCKTFFSRFSASPTFPESWVSRWLCDRHCYVVAVCQRSCCNEIRKNVFSSRLGQSARKRLSGYLFENTSKHVPCVCLPQEINSVSAFRYSHGREMSSGWNSALWFSKESCRVTVVMALAFICRLSNSC